MLTCLIVALNNWKYYITKKYFIDFDDLDEVGVTAVAELMFELCLLILYAVMTRGYNG